MKLSKKDIVLYFFSTIGIMFLLYLLIGGIILKRSFDKNLEYSEAIVIDYFYTIKQTNYFSYKFFIEEEEYQGSGKYYPRSDTLSVGDTIIVVYDRRRPDNNRVQREYRKYFYTKYPNVH